MSLRVFISNRAERLAGILANGLLNDSCGYRAADPLRKTRIIVQSKGMEIWLKQSLVKSGVPVINFEFPFVVKSIRDILAANFGFREVDNIFRRYSESAMTWQIDAILRDDNGILRVMLPEAAENTAECQRFDFAGCAASEFDRLQTYRPEILEAWEAGSNCNCSSALAGLPELWRRLRVKNSDCATTRAGLIKRFLALPEPAPADPVSVFGIGAMPRSYFQIFAKSAEKNIVNFFYTNICREYWAFHPLAKEKLTGKEVDMFASGGDYNPLIKACGHRNREFFQIIETVMDGQNVQWHEEWEENESPSLLGAIQNEVLTMSSPETPQPFDPVADMSLTVHGTHSKMRQVEIVHDLILDAVNQGDMQMNDILVMAPDIGAFAREIQAVFCSGPLQGRFAVTDRNTDENSTLAGCLAALVETALSRFELFRLSRLMQRELLLSNFGLSGQRAAALEKLFFNAGIRWGVDSSMRYEECGVDFEEYSWRSGLDRILAGLALSEGDEFAPVGGCEDREKQQDLTCFLQFFRRLISFREELMKVKTPADWGATVLKAVNDFTGRYADMTEKSILQNAVKSVIADAASGGCSKNTYTFAVFYRGLQKNLSTPPPYSTFLSGKITFSSIQPMRNIPRKMIILMGMDDGQFPRREQVRNIDVFGRRMPGERSRVFDDRAIFLETVLAARERLAFVYCVRPPSGRGDDLPPAAPLKELLAYIKNTRVNGEKITVKHPAYGFMAENFTGVDPRIFSYSGKYLEMAQTVPVFTADFCRDYITDVYSEHERENFAIADICAFLRAPQEYFLKNHLDINVYTDMDFSAESEEFDENKFILARYRNELGREVNSGSNIEKLWEKYSRMAVFPIGNAGRLVFDKVVQECLINNCPVLENWAKQEKTAADVNLPSGDRISGIVEAAANRKSIVKCCFNRIKKKDIIDLYVNYLVLVAGNENNDLPVMAKLVGVQERKYYDMSPVENDEAVKILENITELMKDARNKCPSLLGVSSVAMQLAEGRFDEKNYKGTGFGFAEFDRSNFAVRKCFPVNWEPEYDSNFIEESKSVYSKLGWDKA